jgi:hypothetical protein
VTPASAASDTADACTALVSALYKQAWPKATTDAATVHAKFESHYNASLGKCFFMETVSQMQRSPALNEIQLRETQRLSDANGKQEYGRYDSWNDMPPMNCWVQQTTCGSKLEWTRLTEPFMKE